MDLNLKSSVIRMNGNKWQIKRLSYQLISINSAEMVINNKLKSTSSGLPRFQRRRFVRFVARQASMMYQALLQGVEFECSEAWKRIAPFIIHQLSLSVPRGVPNER